MKPSAAAELTVSLEPSDVTARAQCPKLGEIPGLDSTPSSRAGGPVERFIAQQPQHPAVGPEQSSRFLGDADNWQEIKTLLGL